MSHPANCGAVITLRTSTNSLVGNVAGGTGVPSQLTSVQPSWGSPCTTTTPPLDSGWVSISNGSGLLTFISVPTSIVNSLENATSVISPFEATIGLVAELAYIVWSALVKPSSKTTPLMWRAPGASTGTTGNPSVHATGATR